MKYFVLILTSAISISSFATPKFSSDFPQNLKTQVLSDLDFVTSINGDDSTPLYKSIFSSNALNGNDVANFLDQRVKGYGLNTCGGGAAVFACVISMINPNVMWITNNYQKNNIPQIYRVSVILHESRHTEMNNGGWSHARCPVPYKDDNGNDIVGLISGIKMEGLAACDSTALGAYGMQTVFLKNVEKFCTTCNEKTRMDAQLFGNDGINRISNITARNQLRADVQ